MFATNDDSPSKRKVLDEKIKTISHQYDISQPLSSLVSKTPRMPQIKHLSMGPGYYNTEFTHDIRRNIPENFGSSTNRLSMEEMMQGDATRRPNVVKNDPTPVPAKYTSRQNTVKKIEGKGGFGS